MKQRYDVYGIGNAMVDTEYEVDDGFLAELDIAKGMMTLIDYPRKQELSRKLDRSQIASKNTGGGSAANTIVALSQLGGDTFYSCKVSDDEIGDFYLQDLIDNGVDTNLVGLREDGITGRCIVMVTPDAERTMNTFLGATSNLSGAELVPDAIRKSSWLYLEGYLASQSSSTEAVLEAQRIARESGVKISLTLSDPSMVENFREVFAEFGSHGIDLLFCNREEALMWADTSSMDVAVERLRKETETFVITLGAEGALVYDGNDLNQVDAYPATAIDTNGAGDMFAGAFLYGITHGYSYQLAADLGNRASAKLVARFGARMEGGELLEIRKQKS